MFAFIRLGVGRWHSVKYSGFLQWGHSLWGVEVQYMLFWHLFLHPNFFPFAHSTFKSQKQEYTILIIYATYICIYYLLKYNKKPHSCSLNLQPLVLGLCLSDLLVNMRLKKWLAAASTTRWARKCFPWTNRVTSQRVPWKSHAVIRCQNRGNA